MISRANALAAILALVGYAHAAEQGQRQAMAANGEARELKWLDEVFRFRSNSSQSFQFQMHIATGAEQLDGYVSWAPPRSRCVILRDSADGLPLMIAVDGNAWFYDVIGGQILLIRAEPEFVASSRKGMALRYGIRADFPSAESYTTIDGDFASLLKGTNANQRVQLEDDHDTKRAVSKRGQVTAILETPAQRPSIPRFFALTGEASGGRHVRIEFDSFHVGTPLPFWHRPLDNAALAERVPVLAVADAQQLEPENRERLEKFQGFLREGGVFILRTSLRDDKLRLALTKNSPIKLNFDDMRANERRLKPLWIDALRAQGFTLPKSERNAATEQEALRSGRRD